MSRKIVPHKLKDTIGKRIKTLMARDNVSRDELAEITEISGASISRLRNAVHAPAPETLIAIADYFEVSTDYLLGRTQSQEPVPKMPAPDDLKAMIGKRLDTLLERDDVTQYRLAKDLDKNQSAFTYIRNGSNAPALETLIELADYFEVTTDYFLGRTPPLEQPEQILTENDPATAELT